MAPACSIRMTATLLMVLALASPGEAKKGEESVPLEKDKQEGTLPCDWLEFHATASPKELWVAYRCASPIDMKRGAAYCVYFDTDGDRSTGFRGGEDSFPVGADYLLQGISLYRYTGDEGSQAGLSWAWNLVGQVPNKVSKDWAEFTLSSDSFSITTPNVLVFLLGDNTASGVGGRQPDVMPDNALRQGGGGKCIWIKTE
jgi:hypothetical protein